MILPPGVSSLEGHLCPPGHWCPGGQDAFLCPPGTFRTEPGAASREDCELCPPGYYCPAPELRGHANVFAIPCRAGSECPAGEPASPFPLSPCCYPVPMPSPLKLSPKNITEPPKAHPVFGWVCATWISPRPRCPALLHLPQVPWLRLHAELAPTVGPRLGSPHSALGVMPALLAPPPTLAQGSCEYPTLSE